MAFDLIYIGNTRTTVIVMMAFTGYMHATGLQMEGQMRAHRSDCQQHTFKIDTPSSSRENL